MTTIARLLLILVALVGSLAMPTVAHASFINTGEVRINGYWFETHEAAVTGITTGIPLSLTFGMPYDPTFHADQLMENWDVGVTDGRTYCKGIGTGRLYHGWRVWHRFHCHMKQWIGVTVEETDVNGAAESYWDLTSTYHYIGTAAAPLSIGNPSPEPHTKASSITQTSALGWVQRP
jgi:hypothetical protein